MDVGSFPFLGILYSFPKLQPKLESLMDGNLGFQECSGERNQRMGIALWHDLLPHNIVIKSSNPLGDISHVVSGACGLNGIWSYQKVYGVEIIFYVIGIDT